ncbi:MAG: response regulator [bacterium]
MSYFRGRTENAEGYRLRYKLAIIEFLVIIIPSLILFYIFDSNNIILNSFNLVIIAFTLVLILAGMLLLRQLVDKFIVMADLCKTGKIDENYLRQISKDTTELHEISVTFNTLMDRLKQTTDELESRAFELLTIKELTEVSSKCLSMHDLLNLLLEKAMKVTKAQIGTVFIIDSDKERFHIIASKGHESIPKKDFSLPIKDSLVRSVIYDKEPLLVQDIESDSRTLKPNDHKYQSPSFLCMPIFVREKIIAVINLSNKERARIFTIHDQHVLSIMITEIGFAVENAWLYVRIRENLEKLQSHSAELAKSNKNLQQQIIEKERVEEALKETNKFIRNILDSSSFISIISTDLDGNILFWNKGAEKIFGYRANEIVGHKKIDVVYTDETKNIIKENTTFILEHKQETGCEIRVKSKDGRSLWLKTNSIPTLDEKGTINGILSIGENITQSKDLEEALRQAQKMEAIGTLAGGIAHDFNNILMSIQGNVSVMLSSLKKGDRYNEKLENILRSVRSGADLTNQLLAFARGGKYQVKVTDLNMLIQKTVEMFSRIKKEITVEAKYQPNLWTAEVDQSQMKQVMLNLFVNAWQAMVGGGYLHVQTENVILEESLSKSLKIEPGRYIKIAVTDTGTGMDKKTQQRIFEPFFTTNEMGRGTGLGLASVYGIMKNHEGHISVCSEKGKGTSFFLYLPASDKVVVEEKRVPRNLKKGKETIFLVDDAEMVIDVVPQILNQMGYNVMLARSGKEALKVYKENKDKIDMVILDMIMPNMDGGEVFNRIKKLNPKVKILLSSGYSLNSQASEIMSQGCDGFIQKPYSDEDLSYKIREILDSE